SARAFAPSRSLHQWSMTPFVCARHPGQTPLRQPLLPVTPWLPWSRLWIVYSVSSCALHICWLVFYSTFLRSIDPKTPIAPVYDFLKNIQIGQTRARCDAAIYRDYRPGHIGSRIRGEKTNHLGDLFRLRQPADRYSR